MQKLKNNEPRPKFTGSYEKACSREINYFSSSVRLVSKIKVLRLSSASDMFYECL